ncbi:unnamed protein product, partial [Polarella glacialis]
VIIGCALKNVSGDPLLDSERAAKRGDMTCQNGRWVPSELRCFDDCARFVAGRQYSVLIYGLFDANRSFVPHGTQLLATCAGGFSPFRLENKNTSALDKPGKEATLIDGAECVDGTWTDLALQCLPDCPAIPLSDGLVVDDGGGLRSGSVLRLACSTSSKPPKPPIYVTCGNHGSWELDDEGTHLDLLNIPLNCPSLTLWKRLTDDERALLMLLVIGFLGGLCGLCCLLASRLLRSSAGHEPDEGPEGEDLYVEGQEVDGMIIDEAAGYTDPRRFNLLTGEFVVGVNTELSRPGRGQSGGEGVARDKRRQPPRTPSPLMSLAAETAQKFRRFRDWAAAAADAAAGGDTGHSSPPCLLNGCNKPATHICFPCSHLCLCLVCAEEVMRGGPAGAQAEGAGASCPACAQLVMCAIDAQPSGVFTGAGHFDLVMKASARMAASLLRGGRAASDSTAVRSRVPANTLGRSRMVASERAAAAPPPLSQRVELDDSSSESFPDKLAANSDGLDQSDTHPVSDVATSQLQGDVGTSHEIDKAIRVLALLEDFCSGPEFLAGVQDVFAEHAEKFDDREDDHPHEWYLLFQLYASKVESLLESFLQEQGLDGVEELADLCDWARQMAPDTLFSIDYLAASLEYDDFVSLMLDWKRLQNYEVPLTDPATWGEIEQEPANR